MFWKRSNEYSFTRNGIYAKAFQTLATGLWMTFAGMMMAVGAFALLIITTTLKARGIELGAARHALNGILGLLAGGALLLSLWGKYRCFELQNPMEFGHRLPGHKYLQVAFWSDVLGFVLKTSARTLGVGQLRFLALPASIVSQVTFLLFLRKMADLMGRDDLRRSISWILGLAAAAGTTLCGAFATRGIRPGPALSVSLFGVSLLLAVVVMLAYLVALVRLALAATEFSRYLKEREFEMDDELEGLSSTDPIVAKEY